MLCVSFPCLVFILGIYSISWQSILAWFPCVLVDIIIEDKWPSCEKELAKLTHVWWDNICTNYWNTLKVSYNIRKLSFWGRSHGCSFELWHIRCHQSYKRVDIRWTRSGNWNHWRTLNQLWNVRNQKRYGPRNVRDCAEYYLLLVPVLTCHIQPSPWICIHVL